jgi:N-acetylmuramoyl-L-alanine amidase
MRSDEFTTALDSIYAPGEAWKSLISVEANAGADSSPRMTTPRWALDPSAEGQTVALLGANEPDAPPRRFWRPAATMKPAPDGRPLDGMRIGIDPGHIGGEWARMEERWYQRPGAATEVKEGELTLATAFVLKPMLESLGAEVLMVRQALQPVTSRRPADFASSTLTRQEAERYFYRYAEIRARADLINDVFKPDLVVCLHFNAEPWGDPSNVQFVEANHLHMLVNGHYWADELGFDDVRFEMLLRLFQRAHEEEIPLADEVARSLATATGLPPYDYDRGHMASSAHRVVPENPYVWARNLLANRLYRCPVIYCEPYVMNNREVFERVATGDYPGEKLVSGRLRQSLFREYARGVANGITAHYLKRRPR